MDSAQHIGPSALKKLYRDQLVTVGDLQDVKTELLLAIKAMLQASAQPAPKQWLKSYEVRKTLDISPGTLQTLRNNGTLPFTRIGGILYYDLDDIKKILTSKNRK